MTDQQKNKLDSLRTSENETDAAEEFLELQEAEQDDQESTLPEYEIITYPADFTLEVLAQKYRNGDIRIPEFQRKFVWNQPQASRLIESFLVGLPVPPIFLYTESSDERALVVDGQQRLKSIVYFFNGYFGDNDPQGRRNVFTLKGLDEKSPFANKSFEELEAENPAAVRKLKNSVLRAFIIRQHRPKENTSVFHIFERLNTGGTLLHNQEVRAAIYHGEFNEVLKRCNKDENWRKIIGKKSQDARMRDVELVLRFLALREDAEHYSKPMKDFMTRFMAKNQHEEEDKLESYEATFKETMKTIVEMLGEKPFHLYQGLNSSAFDCVSVAVSRHLSDIPKDFLDRWQLLSKSDNLKTLVKGGTTDVEQVKKRLDLAEKVLFELGGSTPELTPNIAK